MPREKRVAKPKTSPGRGRSPHNEKNVLAGGTTAKRTSRELFPARQNTLKRQMSVTEKSLRESLIDCPYTQTDGDRDLQID